MSIEMEDSIQDIDMPPFETPSLNEDGELLGLLVLDDETISSCMDEDSGRELIEYIERLQEFTGANKLKITIEAFRE